jgi:hypothetical protein
MPSLLGTSVTANYGRMLPQQSNNVPGTDEFSNFGTRQLKIITVTLSSVTNGSLILADGVTADASLTAAQGYVPSLAGYKQRNSLFASCVRTLQSFAEVYFVSKPSATIFTAIIAEDTFNGAEASSNVQATTFGALEAEMQRTIAGTLLATTGLLGTSAATVTVAVASITGATLS